jgi:hypothetical protein
MSMSTNSDGNAINNGDNIPSIIKKGNGTTTTSDVVPVA